MEKSYRVHISCKGWDTGVGWNYEEDLDDFEETLDQLPDEEHQSNYFDFIRDDLRQMEPDDLRRMATSEEDDVRLVVTLTPEDDPEEEPALIFGRWRSELAKELLG